MSDILERLYEDGNAREYNSYALDPRPLLREAAAEIERLTAFLHRISGANDNPSCFNPNVEAVLNEWRALEDK
jgi:hypothetical protein